MSVYNLKQNSSKDKQDPVAEVTAKALKRNHSLRYKRKIVDEAGKITVPGELGALLRREGLSSSTYYGWCKADASGRLRSSCRSKRGPQPLLGEASKAKLSKLEREVMTLKKRAERAEAMLDLQKKMAEFLAMSTAQDEGSK